MWAGVCIGTSATDEVLNCKASRYGGIVCYSSVRVLSLYGGSPGDKPLDAATWLRRLHKRTRTRGDCGFMHSHDKALAAKIPPKAKTMAFLYLRLPGEGGWQWAETAAHLKRTEQAGGGRGRIYHVRCNEDLC